MEKADSSVPFRRKALQRLNFGDTATRRAMEAAFHSAFLGNKVEIAKILLEFYNCKLPVSVLPLSYVSIEALRYLNPQNVLIAICQNLLSQAVQYTV